MQVDQKFVVEFVERLLGVDRLVVESILAAEFAEQRAETIDKRAGVARFPMAEDIDWIDCLLLCFELNFIS